MRLSAKQMLMMDSVGVSMALAIMALWPSNQAVLWVGMVLALQHGFCRVRVRLTSDGGCRRHDALGLWRHFDIAAARGVH
jgi:hypothetical protein